jgi:hypothetical protein
MKIFPLIPSLLAGAAMAAVPSEYVLADITGWTPAQLAELPYFDQFIPIQPAGASSDFVGVARNGLSLTAGNRAFSNTWVQGSGAYVDQGNQSDIPAWLGPQGWSYAWSWTYWDGTDYHFQNGFVTHSPAADANFAGQIIGYATIPGSGSGAGSSTAYSDHAWLRDTATGSHLDLTPAATRAQPRRIDDLGRIVGNWSNDTESHPFLRLADGSFADFTLDHPTAYSLTPTVINNQRLVAGNAIIYTTPRDQRPWVCETGTAVSQLPLPSQNSPDVGVITDLNDHGVLVGHAYKAASPTETSAVRWVKIDGNWIAEDLNELLDDNLDFILDRCVAVNDAGHIIASGHPDGTDTRNTHRLLLTPDVFSPPAVTTLAATDITSTTATLRTKLNACNLATTAAFQHGSSTAYGTDTALAPAAGNVPVSASTSLAGLIPHTTHHFRATATNAQGTSHGADTTFTTPWNWSTWAAETLGSSNPSGDANHNGLPDLVDYATGSTEPPVATAAGGSLLITIHHALLAEGVVLVVQVSDDLLTWHDGSSYALHESTASNAFTTQISRAPAGDETELITVATAGSHRFMRLAARTP